MKTPQFGSLKLPHATEGEAKLVFQGDPPSHPQEVDNGVDRMSGVGEVGDSKEDKEEEARDSLITTLGELQDTNRKLFSAPDAEDLPKTRGRTLIFAIIP